MKTWLRQGEEPRLQDMLDDPVMRSLMKSDGVTREELEVLVRCHPLVGELRPASCDQDSGHDHDARPQTDPSRGEAAEAWAACA